MHANGANPREQALVELVLPPSVPITDATSQGLPGNWREDDAATQAIGNAWIASAASLGMWVPSYVEPMEHNLLLNPAHPAYGSIVLKIERHPFTFDPRLFGT